MAYMQKPGRGPMMKTGRNIPKQFMGPGMYKDGGPQIGQGPGDGKSLKQKLETLTGTTHKGLFSGRQMVASSSRNTDLLKVGREAIGNVGEAIGSAYKKVKSYFD